MNKAPKKGQYDVPLDLILANLRDVKYINAFPNPELYPINKKGGKKTFSHSRAVKSTLMKGVLDDPNLAQQEIAEYNKLKNQQKDSYMPIEGLKKYEEKLDKAYNKKELNRRNRSISPDNFFKFKDFYGAKDEKITESPTKYQPSLKELARQKVAGFESELTRKLRSKKLESPFEWKINIQTPDRPFRDRFKLGTNKISGKITVPQEENAFLAMTAYLEKYKTLYDERTEEPLAKSKSTAKLPTNVPWKANIRSIYLDSLQTLGKETDNFTPRMDMLQTQREAFMTKKLPMIKTERTLRAENWRMRKNRSKGHGLDKMQYYSTKDLNTVTFFPPQNIVP